MPGQYRYLSSQYSESIGTAYYWGVTFDTQLTYLNINQARKRAAHRLGSLGPLLNRSGLSIRNSVLLYEQLIHSVMDNVYHT